MFYRRQTSSYHQRSGEEHPVQLLGLRSDPDHRCGDHSHDLSWRWIAHRANQSIRLRLAPDILHTSQYAIFL